MLHTRAVAVALCLTVCVHARGILPADESLDLKPNADGTFPRASRFNPKATLSQDVVEAVTATGNPKTQAPLKLGNNSIVLQYIPGSEKQRTPLDDVNHNAPVYNVPTVNGTVQAKPVASQVVHSMSAKPASNKGKEGQVHALQLRPNDVGGILGLPGNELQLQVGVRIATPVFGSGFNFCISRYFANFPKVGIVIPNPVAWLLPEFLDIGNTISTTLELPSRGTTAPLGARVSPTSDGFLIWLPSLPVIALPDFGFRWGLQVAQLFGVDFGVGWVAVRCGVDFIRV